MPQYSGIWTEQAVMQAVGAGNWPGNPGAPTIGTATAGDASASVTFTAPTDNGGSAITGYTVTSSPGGLTGTGASSPITVSGLTNGTAYTFTVRATNATGTGPASAASNSITPAAPNYIEEVFSTYLYTGTGTTNNIVNNINLSTYGGLVWSKLRTTSSAFSFANALVDTVRGPGIQQVSNSTTANQTQANSLTAFNSDGYTLGADTGQGRFNNSSYGTNTYVNWTFRKQAKFFDVLSFTGTGSVQTISHNLGSVPGCILVKDCTNSGSAWGVYHTSLGNTQYVQLQDTAAAQSSTGYWNNTSPTSTQFTVGTNGNVNQAGATYIAYLFASNAGGFGLTGTDNVISCGSFTTTSGYSPNVELGYEPQWIMLKRTDSTGNWLIVDTMRGWVNPAGTAADDANLRPNLSDAEATNDIGWPYATGFNAGYRGGAESTWIYIAIRRGPMKVPTSGTSVFSPVTQTGGSFVTTNFPVDSVISTGKTNPSAVGGIAWLDRLRGSSIYSVTSSTAAETNAGSVLYGWNYSNIGYQDYAYAGTGASGIYWNFRRAPSFFDEVCYTGTGANRTVTHNLGVAPELMIVKRRDSLGAWNVWNTYIAGLDAANVMQLESTDAVGPVASVFNSTSPTSSVFTVGTAGRTNASGGTYVAYLFATCAGVSKVGNYTGNGTTQTISCGFASGARFVLLKRTDSTGDWYVWDTARGMVSGTDPSLLLNSTAAEVNANSIYTTAVGFQIVSTAAGINASGGTYIFLAIA